MRLDTDRLLLRELEESDAPAVNVWESDPQVVRYQSNDTSSLEESLARIRKNRVRAAGGAPRSLYELAVVRREDEQVIGRVGMSIQRPEHREAEVWFVFRRDCWGRGYALEAMRALVDHAFGVLGLHRLYGDCDPRNTGSFRLMERLGMKREAHLRENWWLKGEWCDSWIYGLLDREWAAARG
jgi:RimJ/RimL family protein N-acetyltransferase